MNASLALAAFLVASDLGVLPEHPTMVQAVQHRMVAGLAYVAAIVIAALFVLFVTQRNTPST